MSAPENSLRQDLSQVGRGMLMGAADIVPGVSGGTMALILGIYQRLVTALSRVDTTLLGHVGRQEWVAAAEYLDLRFLIALGAGIGMGVLSLASLMHDLLEHQMAPTFGAFFGLILASSVIVARMVERWGPGELGLGALGIAFAFWLTGQVPANVDFGYGYLFLCGSIAICAMILPGISGAFVLLIMGMYYNVTGVLKGLAGGDVSAEALMILVVFALGAATGLLGFSKLLRWLLERYQGLTLSLLCGFMLGSLRRIYPYKVEVDPSADKDFKERVFENVAPWAFDGDVVLPAVLAVVAIGFVLALDRFGSAAEEK